MKLQAILVVFISCFFVAIAGAEPAVIIPGSHVSALGLGREVALRTEAELSSDGSPAELLSSQLGSMFKEGATKLQPPRPRKALAPRRDGGVTPEGGRSLRVTAYSYCLSGRTASGRATAYGCVAVDPRVIPLGSRLYIPGYGWAVAADTGGAIVGNKIDVWFPSLGQCYQWGVRPVTIKVFPRS